MSTKEKNYSRGLDIIRAMSCVMVLLYHLNILKGGYLAVCTFFVLSGYLSCASSFRKSSFSIRNYYGNRFKKIYIPLFVVVAATIIFAKLLPNINWLNLKWESTSVLLGYNNFWQLTANLDYFTRHIDSPFMQFWYIAILLQFELIFPIGFAVFSKIGKKLKNFSTFIIGLATIATTAVFLHMSKTQNIMMVYYNTLARSFSIFWGIMLAIMCHKYHFKIPKIMEKCRSLVFIVYAAALVALCIFVTASSEYYALYMLLATFISARLIRYSIISKEETRMGHVLDSIAKGCAKFTYEIFLVQYPVIFFIQNVSLDINEYAQTALIVVTTLITAIILHILTNFKSKELLVKFVMKFLIVYAISCVGLYFIICEADTTQEMKDLESQLDENRKLIEARNEDYINNRNLEEEEWNKTLENIEDEEQKIAEKVKNMRVVGVGDSVMLIAVPGLYKVFPNGYFDGKVSRSTYGGLEVIEELKSKNILGEVVILALANNSNFNASILDKLVAAIGDDRTIYWINAVKADDPKFNERFSEYIKDHPNIHIIDWVGKSKDHPEYFSSDGIHPKTQTAIDAYANTVYEAIYNDYLEEYRNSNKEILEKHTQQEKSKFVFYGSETLIGAYNSLSQEHENAEFNAKDDYNFEKLYKELEEKVESNSLEYNVVIILDEKLKLSNEELNKIVALCENHKIYVCNVTDSQIQNKNITMIDFYSEIKKNPDYLMFDKKHLSKKGNEELANMIYTETDQTN